MYAPTKVWRNWHQKINLNQRRYAVASALAASAVPALVMARGHRIGKVPELPLVVSDSAQSVAKTANAVALLKKVGAYQDVLRVKQSKKLRAGKGKGRNRRYVQKKGPLVIFAKDDGISRAFRNIPGVNLCDVTRLNLLHLAPGGHVGRFVIWTEAAFRKLDALYGSYTRAAQLKKGYQLPRPKMTNADLGRVINSDEIQSILRPKRQLVRRPRQKKNPLNNHHALIRLNPFAAVAIRKGYANRLRAVAHKKAGKGKALKLRKGEKAKKPGKKDAKADANAKKNRAAISKRRAASKRAFLERLRS